MASIIKFPPRHPLNADLQGHLEKIRTAAIDPSLSMIESVLALLEQVQRTNASIQAYKTEIGMS